MIGHLPQRRALIEFQADRVVKLYENPVHARLETAKTAAAGRVAARFDSFSVPRVVDGPPGTCALERLTGLVGIRSLLATPGKSHTIAGDAGRVLAQVHLALELPSSERICLPPPFLEPDPVPLHGDFAPVNIHFSESTKRLVILDWSTPYWAGPPATLGSSFWDICIFLLDLFHQRPLELHYVSHPERLANAFVASYSGVRPIEWAGVFQYGRRQLALFYPYSCRRPIYRISRFPSLARYLLFLWRLQHS